MKILFYTDTPNYGGAEKQMETLAKHLCTIGCTVSLACGAYSELSKKTDDLALIYEDVFILDTVHKHDPRHYFGLKKLLQSGNYDLIHIHLWNPGSCRYAFWAAKKAGVPIVTTEHDPFPLKGIKDFIKRKCLKMTDWIITVSMDNYRQLSEYGEDVQKRLSTVNNGIELDRFLDNTDSVTSFANDGHRSSLDVKQGDLPAACLPVGMGRQGMVITCVAELHERKGQKYLIEAFKKLLAEFPNIHLMLVGNGPDAKNLKKQYGTIENIHFLGWRNDIPQILRASYIFVLPSLREAFGLVLLEAMASGVAVIATDNGGTKDIIEDGKTGYLVPPQNTERIMEAMRTLLYNPSQKANMEKAALKRVQTMFTADVMAKKTLEVYKKLLKVN